MKKAENIRQEIFDKINAMSDDELARYIWKSRMRNSGVKWLTVISIVSWFVAMMMNAALSISFWSFSLLYIVCSIILIVLTDKIWYFESLILVLGCIAIEICLVAGVGQFLLQIPCFSYPIALLLLVNLISIYRKSSAKIKKCEENAAKKAFLCRKQQLPFTIEQIPYPISWKYAIMQTCVCFVLFFKVVLQLSALYTAIVDHCYPWPADYTIPERTVYYHIWHNNSILFKEQISQKIIRTSPNLVIRITVPRHAQFSYRALSLFNPIISEKRYDSTKPRFEEIEYTLSKEIKNME